MVLPEKRKPHSHHEDVGIWDTVPVTSLVGSVLPLPDEWSCSDPSHRAPFSGCNTCLRSQTFIYGNWLFTRLLHLGFFLKCSFWGWGRVGSPSNFLICRQRWENTHFQSLSIHHLLRLSILPKPHWETWWRRLHRVQCEVVSEAWFQYRYLEFGDSLVVSGNKQAYSI